MKIVVIVPCLNEEMTIFKVVEEFKKELRTAKIYVYDNESTDKTVAEAERAGAKVRVVKKRGKGRVLRQAFSEVEAECYVVVDGDATYPPGAVKKMCELVKQGVDMVVGDRLSSTYDEENKRLFHECGNRLVRWLVNKLFGGNYKDVLSGYRAFSRRFVEGFPARYDGFEVETEMSIWALKTEMKIAEVPVLYRDRPEGSKSKLKTVKDGIKVIKAIFELKVSCGRRGRRGGGRVA